MAESENIFSNHIELISTEEKEKFLSQKGIVIWFTGLSGSGKTTLAYHLEKKLFELGFLSKVLDGDVLRLSLNKGIGFTDEGRIENIRRTAEVCKILSSCGIISICSLITPNNTLRELARNISGETNFHLVYLSTPLSVCEDRDVKGHYAKARKGEIKGFTGVSSGFEIPSNSNLNIDTSKLSVDECVSAIINYILPFIQK